MKSTRIAALTAMLAALSIVVACRDNSLLDPNTAVISWDGIDPATRKEVGECDSGMELRAATVAERKQLKSKRTGRRAEPSIYALNGCEGVYWVECDPNVAFAAEAYCSLQVSPAELSLTVLGWSFDGPNGIQVLGTTTSDHWNGPMVVSGVVRVDFVFNGNYYDENDYIAVQPRSWSWANLVGGRQATPGEIDACILADSIGGFTGGESCTATMKDHLFTPASSSQVFYSPGLVIGGPNDGLFFVSSPGVTMQLRTQINRRYRVDGTQMTLANSPGVQAVCQSAYGDTLDRNTYEVNMVCYGGMYYPPTNGFSAYVSHIWNHEQLHMNAAIAAAKTPAGDLHKQLSTLIYDDYGLLAFEASERFYVTHDFVHTQSLATHTGGTTTFNFWDRVPTQTSKWLWTFHTVLD